MKILKPAAFVLAICLPFPSLAASGQVKEALEAEAKARDAVAQAWDATAQAWDAAAQAYDAAVQAWERAAAQALEQAPDP